MEDCLLDCYFLCLAIEKHVYNSPCFYLLLFICLFLQDLPLSHCLFLRGKNESAFHPGPHTVDDAFSLFRSRDFLLLLFSGTLRPRYSTSPHCATAHTERETRQRDTSIHHLRVRERERKSPCSSPFILNTSEEKGKKICFCVI
jgi:hypothetical protein